MKNSVESQNLHAVRTRFLAPDIARGLMLLFIALANVATAWAAADEGMAAGTLGGIQDGSAVDKVAVVLSAMFVHVRGLPMFSTLLGFGVGMISLSLLRRGYPRPEAQKVLARRYGVLVAFGVVHAVLLFFGDIMFSYGLCGLVLTLLIGLDNKKLMWIAGVLWGVGVVLSFPFLLVSADSVFQVPDSYLEYMGMGGIALLSYLFASPILLLQLLPPMLVGLLMARMLVLHDVPAHARALRAWAGVAVAFILLVGLPWGLAEIGVLPETWARALHTLNEAAGLITGPGLVALIALAAQPAQRRLEADGSMNPVVGALVALGKRSMSGYVGQSLVFCVVILPFTLNLAEGMGAAGKSLIACGVWVVTLLAAVALERMGRPGPLERMHRRLSYGRAGLQEAWAPGGSKGTKKSPENVKVLESKSRTSERVSAMSSPDNPYVEKPANSFEGEDGKEPPLLSVPMSTDPEADAAVQATGEAGAGWVVAAEEKNRLAPWALGLGIASLILLFTIVLPIVVGLVGIILGIMAVRSAKKNTTQGRRMGMSVTALVLSAVSFVLSIAMVIAIGVFFAPMAKDMMDCSKQYPERSSEWEQCIQDVAEAGVS